MLVRRRMLGLISVFACVSSLPALAEHVIKPSRVASYDLSNGLGSSQGELFDDRTERKALARNRFSRVEESGDERQQFHAHKESAVLEAGTGFESTSVDIENVPLPRLEKVDSEDASVSTSGGALQASLCSLGGCDSREAVLSSGIYGADSRRKGGTTLSRQQFLTEAYWTLSQQPHTCSLTLFNASWPLINSYKLEGSTGLEQCSADQSLWIGLFQLDVSKAVDSMFEEVCQGHMDLSRYPLAEHIEQMSPSEAFNRGIQEPYRLQKMSHVLGPTTTSTIGSRTRQELEASGTVFLMVRNSCDGLVSIRIRQSLMARMNLAVHNALEVVDLALLFVAAAAATMFIYAAFTLCKALQQLKKIEELETMPSCEGKPLDSRLSIKEQLSEVKPLLESSKNSLS